MDAESRHSSTGGRAAEILAEREARTRRLAYRAGGLVYAVVLTAAYSCILIGAGHGVGPLGLCLLIWPGDVEPMLPTLSAQVATILLFVSPLLPGFQVFRAAYVAGVALQGLSLVLTWRELDHSANDLYWVMTAPWMAVAVGTVWRLARRRV